MTVFERIGQIVDTEKWKILRWFYEPENLEFKTDLSSERVLVHSKIISLNELAKNELGINLELDGLITVLEKRYVSLKREGRTEGFSVLKSPEEEELKKKSLREKLVGF